MSDQFLMLSAKERRDALGTAADKTGRPAPLLEKDVWVVWALARLFASSYGADLIFKGGTSLSKAYDAIKRFSEDVDITYDIRKIAPDLTGEDGKALPRSRSQEKRWSKEVRGRLALWMEEALQPLVDEAIASEGMAAETRREGDRLFIDYESTVSASSYVVPSVALEFGARSTGEPAEIRKVVCDAAEPLEALAFPDALPRVMAAERTFWEKATAIHVYCMQEKLRGERFSRHWYDLVKLDEAGYAATALADRALARAVAEHKGMFFAAKALDHTAIDYMDAVNGGLRLVPEAVARHELAEDYQRMTEAGLLLEDAGPFANLMERCADIATRANQAAAGGQASG